MAEKDTPQDEQVKATEETSGVKVAEAQNNLPTGLTEEVSGEFVTTAGSDRNVVDKGEADEVRYPLPSELADVQRRYDLTAPEAEKVFIESKGKPGKAQDKAAEEVRAARRIVQQQYVEVVAPAVAASPLGTTE